MSRKSLFGGAFPLLLLLAIPCKARAFVLFDIPERSSVFRAESPPKPSANILKLVSQLEEITGLQLQIHNQYLRVKEPERLPLLYAGSGMRDVFKPVQPGRRWSSTARQLLLGAIRSISVYHVREDRAAALGRVDPEQTIELDFADFSGIVYRDVPRETFDAGMIFLHELTHCYLKLKDPTAEEVKRNRHVKGETVEFINRIERELGVPERQHYAPMKIRFVRQDPKWGIYFGNKPDRIEFDTRFVVR